MPLTVMGIVYLICAAIYLPIVLYLLRASKEAKTAALMNDNNALANFLLYSKKYWKYNGIVTIIVLCITLLVIIFSVIAAVTAAALLQ
jgi:Ca2+/Na+ antiporter